jgi:2-amino-4-hydroxy-6-hydroxymethyldihydropteridine diphosphokinase
MGRFKKSGSPEGGRFDPRQLDIDILLYGDRVISGPDHLHIPHLLMHERRFVLHPLADLAPELEHPVLYQTIRELLLALEDEHQVLMADLPRRWFER